MIKFIKILSYRLKPKNGDIFGYLNDLTSQKIDPHTNEPGKLKLKEYVVLHSTLLRAVECIHRDKNTEYIGLTDLNEIGFDLEKICGEKLWKKEKSKVVRRKFKEAFIKDDLHISRKEIFDGIRKVLLLCKAKSKKGDVAVVSHSFRLAIIEAYIKTKGEIEKKPELIHNYIFDDKKRYEFGGGFEINKL